MGGRQTPQAGHDLYSDSKYAINVLTGRWKAWKNLDIVSEVLEVASKIDVTMIWVKGHNGHVYNEQADVLAGQAAHDVKAMEIVR